MQFRNQKSVEKIEPQMAPMIDVVFLLLIFFMCTLKIISPEGDFSINMPAVAQAQTETPKLLPDFKVRLLADVATGQLLEVRFGQRSLGNGPRAFQLLQQTIKEQIAGSPYADEVEIDNIDAVAPDEVRGLKGNNFITSLGLTISRNTTDSRVFPTRGSDASIGIRYAGLLGGDFDFTAATAEFIQFWTVDEDVFDRKSVLSLRMEFGYIFEDDEAPFFERLYAGGHRSFRGFEFRGVGPRGTRGGVTTDDPVGGEWLFLLGPQYHFPIYQEVLRGVIFLDTGTVQKDVGFSKYRVSIGTGLRLKVPFLGAAPVALDLAIPILKEDGDEEQIFSFDIALPF